VATGTLAQMALAAVPRRPQMLIGGKWVDSDSGETFATFNPATGEKLAEVPRGGTADVDRSVQAAQQAFPAWSRTEARERGKLVARIADKLREHADELGLLDALDSGNPYKAMKGDAILAAEFLDYFAGLALEIKGDTIPSPGNTLNFTLREPYGVVGRIIPFNHPIYFAGGKIGAPLVAGNTVILKPAEQTPLSALVMGKLIEGILPPGVLNIVTGDGPLTGETLVRHSGVRKVALTGGVETGRAVMRNAADAIKSVTLELGGKNPMIVFPDVNLEEAVESAVAGMNFGWCQGQSCGSTSRLFLHESIHDSFLEKLVARVRRIKIGSPLAEDTEMGSLISRDQYDKVMGYIELGKKEGARLVTGGKKLAGEEFARGFFVEPTVFDGVSMSMRLAREEIFGPVLSVLRWSNREQVIAEANQVVYGLTASIWTNDISLALDTARRVEAGYVWINGSSRHFFGAPFGGYKQSGLGKEESLEELLSYTQVKNINVNVRP